MNIRSGNYPNLINIFGNIESEKLGFYLSFLLHLIFLFFVIGFPNFFKSAPIYIPTVIPIEIVNIGELTSVPKEIDETANQEKMVERTKQKKFNDIQPELIKRVETKNESKIDSEKIIVKKEKKVEQDIKSLIKIDENKKNIQEEKFESLPIKKIKPKIKPKPISIENTTQDTDIKIKSKPKPSFDISLRNIENTTQDTDINVKSKPKPSFDISSMLKDIRNDQAIMNAEKIAKDSTKEKIAIKNEDNQSKAQLSISEIDLLIQQLSSCWSAPAGAVIKKGMVVKISAKIKPDKNVLHQSVRIIDTNIPQSNPFYGPITESAMRTLLNPECNPLRLPDKKYDLWKNLTVIFDHSIMKGY